MEFDYEKIQLKKLILLKGLVVTKKLITLSSGKKSHHYYDIRKIVSDPIGINLLSTVLLCEVLKFGPVKSVGGLEVGAISISTGISMKAHEADLNIGSFYVRKKPKDHGLKRNIEGQVVEPIVIVDDVITRGDSVFLAINALRQIRKKMLGVVTVIDRGGGKVLVKNGIKHSSIFTERDFSNQVSKRLKELDISHHKSEK